MTESNIYVDATDRMEDEALTPKIRFKHTWVKGVSMIRVDFGPISETVYIDIILNTIIER